MKYYNGYYHQNINKSRLNISFEKKKYFLENGFAWLKDVI